MVYDNKEFLDIVQRVKLINDRLRVKDFSCNEIDAFWTRIIRLAPTIEKIGIDNINVCKGCGHLDCEPIRHSALACCPDNNYIPVTPK